MPGLGKRLDGGMQLLNFAAKGRVRLGSWQVVRQVEERKC